MMFKRIFMIICLVICLFSIASVCAGEANDTAIASADVMELSQGDNIETDDLTTQEVDSPSALTDNGGVVLQTNDNGTFSDLQDKINATEEWGTVNLTNDYNYGESEKEISITKAITINGNGFTINGMEKSRIFNIEASGNIVLSNITFLNGNSDLGGAVIFNNDVSDVVIDNCRFIDNYAAKNGGALYFNGTFKNSAITNTEFISNAASKNGGAVYVLNSSAENLFENLTFADNRAQDKDGGAINFHWELIKTGFTNVTFSNNRAGSSGGAINTDQNVNDNNKYVNVDFISNSASKGGAINGYGQSHGNSFSGCSFENNSASASGGAIYYARNIQYTVFENSSFVKNTAKTGNGGTIYTNMAFRFNRFSNDSFINNTAAVNGGSVYVYDKFTDNSIENSEFISNVASSNGGAVYTRGSSSANVFENMTFSSNRANKADGGAINFHGETSKTSFTNVTFFNNTAGSSGGAINTDNNVNNDNKYVNVDFISNSASKGGALNGYGQSKGNSFEGCSFENNSASSDGGAIYYKGNIQSNVFENTSFITNTARAGNGGAIFAYRAASSNKFNKSLFINNGAAVNGGALYVNATFTDNSVENSEFKNNTAAKNGGAVYISGASSENTFENSTFSDNVARDKDGGAINFHMEMSETSFTNLTFFNNRAGSGGGAINTDHNVNNYNKYVSVDFISNSASKGGALNGYGQSRGNSFEGCSFENNSASSDGGAIYYKGNIISNAFENSTFTGNTAGNNGGAMFAYRDCVSNSFDNALFIDNSAAINAGAVYCLGSMTSNVFCDSEFRNNSALGMDGGSINVISNLKNTSFNGVTFKDNTACGNGGAINVDGIVNNTTFTGAVFINNNASKDGAAFSFQNADAFAAVNGIFINNTGDSVIKIYESTPDSIIRDSIFLNNDAAKVQVNSGSIKLTDNWFGNNATNYNETPDVGSADIVSWLFLNATADPSEVGIYKSSRITFRLYSYDGTTVSDYDASKMNIVLDLTPTKGELNQSTALIGEEVSYAVKELGNGSVNARFETASYVISLKNIDDRIPTAINVTNSTIELKVLDEVDSGASLTPGDAGNLTYSSSNPSVAVVENGKIKAVSEGNATITVSFAGNLNYKPAENRTIMVTVTLKDASVNVTKTYYELFIGENDTIVATAVPEDLKVNFTTDDYDIISVDDNGRIIAVGEGNAVIFVSVGDNVVYKYDYVAVNVTVRKVIPEINISDVSGTFGETLNVTVTVAGGNASGNVALKVDGVEMGTAALQSGAANFTLSGIDAGSHVMEVIYSGDGYYSNATANKTFKVNKLSTKLLANGITAVFNVNKDLVISLNDANGDAVIGAKVIIALGGKTSTLTTDDSGKVKLTIKNLSPKTYIAKAQFKGNTNYKASAKSIKVNVIKATPKFVAKAKAFKLADKTKKYVVILKDNKNKVMKGKMVYIRVNGVTYSAKTNSKGQATFKLTKLTKAGTFNSGLTFKGDAYYKKAYRAVKIVVKK